MKSDTFDVTCGCIWLAVVIGFWVTVGVIVFHFVGKAW